VSARNRSVVGRTPARRTSRRTTSCNRTGATDLSPPANGAYRRVVGGVGLDNRRKRSGWWSVAIALLAVMVAAWIIVASLLSNGVITS
jgi:hypothetical protein